MLVKQVFSKDNKYVKLARQLNRRKLREKLGLFVLEGIRSLEDVLRSDYLLQAILINSSFKKKTKSEELLLKIDTNVPVIELEDNLFEELALTETPQGVILIIQQKKYELESVLDSAPQFVIIADGIQDPGNLGTIIRTSASAGTSGLLVTKGCVDIHNPKVVRASMGGIFFIPVMAIDDCESLIVSLKLRGYSIVVADLAGKKMYYNVALKQPIALVIGNENSGPSQLLKQNADFIIKIPMLGKVESLNAGVAAGILIYDTIRQNSY